jgi:protein SCO1
MRFSHVLSSAPLAGIIAAVLLLAACGGRPADRRYELNGQVLSVASDRTEATIKHQDIPNFMQGMTMPFQVRDATELDGITPGDLITATLVVESNGAYITDVVRTGEAPLDAPPVASAASGFELLKPGEPVPLTEFVDQDGRARTFESFRGSTVLLTFIFTRCPMPTFCPLMDRHFLALQQRMGSEPALQNVHLVTVSFDPITDTPAVLKAHAETLGADTSTWTFLTGDRDEIDQFAMRFGLSISRNVDDPVDITHTLRTAIVGPDGRLVKTYTGNSWSPEDILADLEKGAAAP